MPQNRTKTGRFKPGSSGNPGGRPKRTPEQRDALEAVAAWNDYKPEQITQDAELLKIGVALGVERLERLAEKHKDNPLMQNLIMNKANEENVHINVPGFWMKDYRESEFASYAGRAAMSIREPESIRAGLFEADYSVPDVVNVDY